MTAMIRLKRLLMGVFTTSLVTAALCESFSQEPAKSTTETSIVKLLRKRHAVLSQLVRVQTQAYTQGEADIEAVVQAHQELLLVELELAANHGEKIRLIRKAVRLAGELENIAEAKFKAGQASQADVLRSRAEKLRAETDLLRELQESKQE